MRLLYLLLITFAICGLAWSQGSHVCNGLTATCGDGLKGFNEECDDNNTKSGDGCSSTCTIETGYGCTLFDNCSSDCTFVYLLDLSADDGLPNLNHRDLILYDASSYLIDNNSYIYALIGGQKWDNISVVIMRNEDNSNNGEYIQLQISGALQDGRLNNVSLVNDVIRDEIEVTPNTTTELERILGAEIFRGYIYTPKASVDGDDFVDATLRSLRYFHEDQYNFVPRNVCIVPQSNGYHSVSCITIMFIGRNTDPPQLMYTAAEMSRFTEGQASPTLVFNGNLTVTDPNNPIYLMEQATIVIFGGQRQFETLSLNETFNDLTVVYDANSVRLTITGNATTDVYQRVIESVLYDNTNDEPDQETRTRTISVFLSDGIGLGQLEVDLLLINSNDIPTILFSPSNLTSYYERNGSVTVDSGLTVVDADPNEMIQKVVISIMNPIDGVNEMITVESTHPNITVNSELHRLVLTGIATPSDYQNTLRTVRYRHNDTLPGNPTAGSRTIQFYIEDDQSVNKTINLSFIIIPINDAPEMSFFNSSLTKTLQYREDDPPLFVFDDLNLRDVDSDLNIAVLQFTGLLDGLNDNFNVNQTLLSNYGLNIVVNNQPYSRTIDITGNASSTQYSEVLQSLAYTNLIPNNNVTDGVRSVSLQVHDVYGLPSPSVSIRLEVSERNDEPNARIDAILNYTENTQSERIISRHLISIMDEELNNISSINITLTATNGELDAGDSIFIRSTVETPSLIDKATVTRVSIYIPCEGTVSQYEEILRAIYYVNQEDEPTYYVNATSREKLRREIIVELKDDNATHPSTAVHHILVNITLVNDHTPVVRLNLTDSSCQVSYPPHNNVNKRSARFIATTTTASHSQRRLPIKRKSATNIGMSPIVETAYTQVSYLFDNVTCLSNITITFNTNTTTPIVEVKRDLQDILVLFPSDLNLLPHYGKWINKRTLLINFMGCNQLTNDEVHVVFRGSKDHCDASTSCTSGICFANKTGCPVTGLHHTINNSTVFSNIEMTNITTSLPPSYQTSPHLLPYFLLFVLLTLALIVLIVGAKLMYCMEKTSRRASLQKTSLKRDKNVPDTAKQKIPETLQPSYVLKSTVKTTEEATTASSNTVATVDTKSVKPTSSLPSTSSTDNKGTASIVTIQESTAVSRQSPTQKVVTASSQQNMSKVLHKKANNSNNDQLVKLPEH